MTTVLWFYLLVCCGAAEAFTEKSVDLGQNVTLKCQVGVRDVFWFLIKPSESLVIILRSYSIMALEPIYSNMTFSKIYSVQYNSSLFIHNISTNELGVYYCLRTGSPPDIGSGIRLYIRNHSADNRTGSKEVVLLPILIISVIMNFVLAVPVAVRQCRRFRKTRAQPSNPGLQPRQDSTDHVEDPDELDDRVVVHVGTVPAAAKTESPTFESCIVLNLTYAEVQFSTTNGPVRTANGPVRTANLDSTYALVNL